MDAMGFRDTFAHVVDDRVIIVWARERQWWTQHSMGEEAMNEPTLDTLTHRLDRLEPHYGVEERQ
jgi:hypothetical protein